MSMHLSSALKDDGEWRGGSCPVDNAAVIIGSRPTLLIIREAFYGTTRFDDFVEHTRLTTAVVSSRLKTLVSNLVLAPRPYQEAGKRTRIEYVLTEKGDALLPLLLALMQWGSDHILDGGPVLATDAASGQQIAMLLSGGGRVPISADQVVISPNPSWPVAT